MIKAGVIQELQLPLDEAELGNILAKANEVMGNNSDFAETVKIMADTPPISNEELKHRNK